MKKYATIADAVGTRLHQIYDMATSVDWSLVGKSVGFRDPVTGRIEEGGRRVRGGWFNDFPELSDGPAKAAKAIKAGKGLVYRRIVRQVTAAVLPYVKRERKKKTPSVPAHESVTGKCKLCHVAHSKKQHRFHGPGAFHKTHLWGFNMNQRRRAKRNGLTVSNVVERGSTATITVSPTHTNTETVRSPVKTSTKTSTETRSPTSTSTSTNPRGRRRKLRRARANPSSSVYLIYGKVLQVTAQKTQKHRCDAGCREVNHRYFHDFKTSPKEWGLPAGAVIVLPSGQRLKVKERSLLIAKSLAS